MPRPGLIPKPSFVSHICLEARAGPARDNKSAAARGPRCQLSVASLLVGSKTRRGEGKVTNPNRTYHFSAIPLPDSEASVCSRSPQRSRRSPVRRRWQRHMSLRRGKAESIERFQTTSRLPVAHLLALRRRAKVFSEPADLNYGPCFKQNPDETRRWFSYNRET